MIETDYHTYDIFDNDNENKRMRYFDFCHNKALECGLICRCILRDRYPKLELWGSRHQFFRYYLLTLTKCEYKSKGIKRWLSVLFW